MIRKCPVALFREWEHDLGMRVCFLCVSAEALVPRWKCLVCRRAGNLQPPVIYVYARRSEPRETQLGARIHPLGRAAEKRGRHQYNLKPNIAALDNVSVICSPNDGCSWRFFDEREHADETANQALCDVFHPIRAVFSISLCETPPPHYGGAGFFMRAVICKIAGVKSLLFAADIPAHFTWHRFRVVWCHITNHAIIILNVQPWKREIEMYDWLI